MKYYAHIRQLPDGTVEHQSVLDHLAGTAGRAAKCLSSVGLGNTAYLAGILHDLGKYTDQFQEYLSGSISAQRGSVIHTFQGCQYLMDRFHDGDFLTVITAELISYAIGAHHGLFDCVDASGQIGFKYRREKREIHTQEAMQQFLTQYGSEEALTERFDLAKAEIETILDRVDSCYPGNAEYCFQIGLLSRLILSAVIEGDRYNTASFMDGVCHKEWPSDMAPIWQERLHHMEEKLATYPTNTPVAKARHAISEQCAAFAQKTPNIYRLNVPTGSGKTLSSLRYALAHGMHYHKKRLIFTSPLLSILEQNAKEIRKFVGDDSLILEHHSNVVQTAATRQELDQRELLVSSWDAPIIITTLVQLLDTLFDGATTSIRRFHALCDSVIVIDEVQTVPTKMLTLFNQAIQFLSEQCGTTVILCSATQPELGFADHPLRSTPEEIVPYNKEIWDAFRRTDIRPLGSLRLEEFSDKIRARLDETDSLLVVCNKKDEAAYLLQETKSPDYQSFHLSASMCMAHRRETIAALQEALNNHERVLCISTQVIEAGVDISFQCVIRLTAGLDSVIQSAGRCNRHGESALPRPVYTIDCADERLGKLTDIRRGKDAANCLFDAFQKNPARFGNNLASDEAVKFYYRAFYQGMEEGEQDDYIPRLDATVFDLLSENSKYADAGVDNVEGYALWQAFKTAGQNFSVFDNNTTDVVVPYKKGKVLIQDLCSEKGKFDASYREDKLKELSGYTVSLYQYQKEALEKKNALVPIWDGTVLVLAEGFYDDETGLNTKETRQDFWEV